MDKKNAINQLFGLKKPIIGMIHLAGRNTDEKIKRALEELTIYEQEGVNGVIIENYHGNMEEVKEVLKLSRRRFDNLVRGINILRNPYFGFKLAQDYEAKFVQFDSVQTRDLNLGLYNRLREEFPSIFVLGGVGFKYIPPTGNPLEVNLADGKSRCDAIVTTGEGTGIETPLEKLKLYRELLGDFPLIVGAGVNLDNVCEQLAITDGAIIGSYFKPRGNTRLPIDRKKVKDLMDLVRHLRNPQTQ